MRIKRKEKRLPAALGPQVGLVFLTPPTKIYNNITYIVFTHFSAYKMKLLFCFCILTCTHMWSTTQKGIYSFCSMIRK